MKHIVIGFATLGLLVSSGYANTFERVASFGDSRFLHEAPVTAAVVLPDEVRTISRGQIWKWTRDGRLLGKVALRPCSAHHGGAIHDAAFSPDGTLALVKCISEGKHALFDGVSGKRLAIVGDLGKAGFCGQRFYGLDSLGRGLQVLEPDSRKVTTWLPKTRPRAVTCSQGHLAVIERDRAIAFLDAAGQASHRVEGDFVSLGVAPNGLVATQSWDLDLYRGDARGKQSVAAVATRYDAVPRQVHMPVADRIVLWNRERRRDHVRVVTASGKVVFETSTNITDVFFEGGDMWVISGPRIDSYRLRDGRSATGSMKNRTLDYYQADLRMSSSHLLWSQVKDEWLALNVDTGAVVHRYLRPDSVSASERDAVMNDREVATLASAGKVRLLGSAGHGSLLESGFQDFEKGFVIADPETGRLALLASGGDQPTRVALWERARGQPAVHAFSERLWSDKLTSVHLLDRQVWLLPSVGHTTVHRIDAATGTRQSFEPNKGRFWARDLAMRDGKVVAVGFDVPFVLRRGRPVYLKKRRLRVYEIGKGTIAERPPPRGVDLLEAHRIGFVPTTGEVWFTMPEKNRLWIFDPTLQRLVFQGSMAEARGRGMRVAFSPDGQAFATQYDDGRIEVWRRRQPVAPRPAGP